jgi:dTDP-3,4-didehydro-2,6-dideoxy-alpha-D-glucose 3-reductase
MTGSSRYAEQQRVQMTLSANNMKMHGERQYLRVGILGCSDIARRRFLPALQKARNARLSVVASRDPEKAKRFCASTECETTDYETLLASKKVDLIYIPLPNHLHEVWVMRALEQGKHVICEKPMALSVGAIERMTQSAGQKGLLLYENIMYLHHPLHQAVRNIIAAGTIGRVTGLRTSFGFMHSATDGFRMRTDQGGGAFFDQARYPLSAALFFLAGSRYRFKGEAFFRNGLNVAMNASALTDCNETFSFSIGFEQPYECWYEIIGEKGKLKVDRAYTTPADMVSVVQVSTDSGVAAVTVPAADHWTGMIERVCDAVLQEQGYHELHGEAMRLAQLGDQVWESCERIQLAPHEKVCP